MRVIQGLLGPELDPRPGDVPAPGRGEAVLRGLAENGGGVIGVEEAAAAGVISAAQLRGRLLDGIPGCGIVADMIRSFGDRRTRALFDDELVRAFHGFADRAKRKLVAIHAASRLEDLRVPPANRLEKLRGDLDGFHSIRINDQWRVIFRWIDGDAHDVQIVDYH